MAGDQWQSCDVSPYDGTGDILSSLQSHRITAQLYIRVLYRMWTGQSLPALAKCAPCARALKRQLPSPAIL
jgi:hypothetical protein